MRERSRSISGARLSVVVPVFNEAEVLPELARRLVSTLGGLPIEFEVILVDDGSTDETPALLAELRSRDPRFCFIRLSRNFGHQAAVTAGLQHVRGEVACVMDADLQDPPEVVPQLLQEWEKGNDVVYAVRRHRKEGRVMVALYDLFYRLLSQLSAVSIPLDAGDFCLMSRRAIDQLNRLPEKERFVRGLRAWVGFSQVGVEYERASRSKGESKYSLFGLMRLALNGVVSFSDKPLIYVAILGGILSLAALLYGTGLVAFRLFFDGVVTGYASLMAGLLFLGGAQLLGLGIVGIYVSKIFQEAKGRPTYIVRSLEGLDSAELPAVGSDQAER